MRIIYLLLAIGLLTSLLIIGCTEDSNSISSPMLSSDTSASQERTDVQSIGATNDKEFTFTEMSYSDIKLPDDCKPIEGSISDGIKADATYSYGATIIGGGWQLWPNPPTNRAKARGIFTWNNFSLSWIRYMTTRCICAAGTFDYDVTGSGSTSGSAKLDGAMEDVQPCQSIASWVNFKVYLGAGQWWNENGPWSTVSASEPFQLKGDATGDGSVNVCDAVQVLRYYHHLDPHPTVGTEQWKSDPVWDGHPDTLDAIWILGGKSSGYERLYEMVEKNGGWGTLKTLKYLEKYAKGVK